MRYRKRLAIYPNREPNPHIIISGMSGYGKSTLFKSFLKDVHRANISCIVFDANNEHENLVRGLGGTVYNAMYSGINILELDNASIGERIAELTRLFKSVYNLGYIQATKLSECLWYVYRKCGARGKSDRSVAKVPTIKDLVNEINIFIKNSRMQGERNALLHLRDRLSLLNTATFTGRSIRANDLEHGVNSFSLSGLRSSESQIIYINELLNRLYSLMHDKPKEHGISLYIMIDEAQFLMGGSEGSRRIISRLIEEGRKYGVGIIIVTHATSTLNKQMVANASTFVSFYAREPSEMGYVIRLLAGTERMRIEMMANMMRKLSQHEAIVISSNLRNPVLVSTAGIAHDMLQKNIKEVKGIDNGMGHAIESIASKPIKEPELTSRLKRMGLNIDAKDFQKFEALERFETNFEGKRETWLMRRNPSLSIEHEVCVRRVSEILDSIDIKHRIIDNSSGPDILAYSNGTTVAIEYETGFKSIADTSRMLAARAKKFSRVIVFVSGRALKFYREYFEKDSIAVFDIQDAAKAIKSSLANI